MELRLIQEKLVRDHIPLKQGLRRRHHFLTPALNSCPRPYSIKTRIKTKVILHKGLLITGPRPYSIKTRIKTPPPYAITQGIPRLRDHIPLKQGLRQRNTYSRRECQH